MWIFFSLAFYPCSALFNSLTSYISIFSSLAFCFLSGTLSRHIFQFRSVSIPILTTKTTFQLFANKFSMKFPFNSHFKAKPKLHFNSFSCIVLQLHIGYGGKYQAVYQQRKKEPEIEKVKSSTTTNDRHKEKKTQSGLHERQSI